jgi:hypothetical protein
MLQYILHACLFESGLQANNSLLSCMMLAYIGAFCGAAPSLLLRIVQLSCNNSVALQLLPATSRCNPTRAMSTAVLLSQRFKPVTRYHTPRRQFILHTKASAIFVFWCADTWY